MTATKKTVPAKADEAPKKKVVRKLTDTQLVARIARDAAELAKRSGNAKAKSPVAKRKLAKK